MQMGTWDLDAEDLSRAGYMLNELAAQVDRMLDENSEELGDSTSSRAEVARLIVDYVCRRLGNVEDPVEADE